MTSKIDVPSNTSSISLLSEDEQVARDRELADGLARTLQHPIVVALSEKLSNLKPVEAPVLADSKLAAVVAIVRVVDNQAEVLFIKRAVLARDPWSGHVAFPGGRKELSDATLVDTAMRETREEMAMDVVRYGKVIGQLDDLAPRSPLLPPIIVRPFVAVVAPTLGFVISEREVADAFWTPINLLRSDEAKTEYALSREGVNSRFPAYGVGAHVVWGLTERIVTQLLPLFGG